MAKRILIVDDEEGITSTMMVTLQEMEGYEVYSTNDSNEAYQLLMAHKFDLLISDIMMPSLTGDQLFRYLGIDPASGRERKRPPLLFISGHVDEQELRDSGRFFEGASFLKKPFDTATLRMKVAEILWKNYGIN